MLFTSRIGTICHQKLINQILVISVPNSEEIDTYFSFSEFLLHDFVNLIAFDICKAMFISESCLRQIDFANRGLRNMPITCDLWQDV